jgi:TolA-binding protein
LLSRVQAMEEQVRQLRGRIDETQNLVNRQNADLSKRIDDLTFQLNLPGRSAAATPFPAPAVPAPPPVREVAPVREPTTRPPPELVRPNEPTPPRIEPPRTLATPAPLPLIIPPPPPAPPKSFTFNQIPEPMREAPQPPAPTPPARIDPIPPVVNRPPEPVRPPEPAPKPPPRVVETIPPAAPEPAPSEVAITPLAPCEKRTPERALQEGHAALARRDYASAEKSAREVMGNRASPRAYDGQYLLAQSLAGQKQFAQAAIAFDDAYNRSHKGRYAQEALLGLAGALTAINEKRAACDTLGRLRVEFPQVRADLKDSITKTNERAGCGR